MNCIAIVQIYPVVIDTFKVCRTRWNIQTLIDQVSLLHSIPVQKSDGNSRSHEKKYIVYFYKLM